MVLKPFTAIIITVFSVFFFASAFPGLKFVLQDFTPWTIAFFRFFIATIVLFILLIALKSLKISTLRRNFVAFLLLGFFGVGVFNAAFATALQTSSTATASLIMATTPVLINLIEAVLARRHLSARMYVGMVLSFAGLALVILHGVEGMKLVRGDGFMLVAAAAWIFYVIATPRLVRGGTALEVTLWTMFFAAIFLFMLASIFEHPLQVAARASHSSWWGVLWLGFFPTALAYYLWSVGIGALGSARTALFFNLVPIFATLMAFSLGEHVGLTQVLGMAVAIMGMLISQWPARGAKARLPAAAR